MRRAPAGALFLPVSGSFFVRPLSRLLIEPKVAVSCFMGSVVIQSAGFGTWS